MFEGKKKKQKTTFSKITKWTFICVSLTRIESLTPMLIPKQWLVWGISLIALIYLDLWLIGSAVKENVRMAIG